MPIDASTARRIRGRFLAGVTIVTTRIDDRPAGLTVSAFTSVSIEPPLVLVCLDRRSRVLDGLVAHGKFAVNVLSEAQQELSNRFAGKADDKFAGLAFRTGPLGLPLFDGCLATMECSVREAFDGGDHTILLGEVENAELSEDGEPLVYWRGGYRKVV